MEFYNSKLSGKKKLCLDDKQLVLYDKKQITYFRHSFKIDNILFEVLQTDDDNFELRIDNRKFVSIWNDERNGKLKRIKEEYLKKERENKLREEREKEEREKKKKKKKKFLMKKMNIIEEL